MVIASKEVIIYTARRRPGWYLDQPPGKSFVKLESQTDRNQPNNKDQSLKRRIQNKNRKTRSQSDKTVSIPKLLKVTLVSLDLLLILKYITNKKKTTHLFLVLVATSVFFPRMCNVME